MRMCCMATCNCKRDWEMIIGLCPGGERNSFWWTISYRPSYSPVIHLYPSFTHTTHSVFDAGDKPKPSLFVTFSSNSRIARSYRIFFKFLLLFSYSCPTFSPWLTPTRPPPLPQPIPYIVHAHESSIRVPLLVPFPSFPYYPPFPSPLVTVSLFFISTSLILFCSFVCFVD